MKKHHGAGNYELARQASDKAYSYSKMSIIIGIILNIVSGVLFGVFAYFRVTAINNTNSQWLPVVTMIATMDETNKFSLVLYEII